MIQRGTLVGTVIVGIAQRYLNVADKIPETKRRRALKSFSTGDQTLWSRFPHAISENSPGDPARTAAEFKKLKTRHPARTHENGFDWLLLVPMQIDNVNPPTIPFPNPLGIDVAAEYDRMIEHICKAYTARWHL